MKYNIKEQDHIRTNDMILRRKQGQTYAEIGKVYNLSRQRVHIILSKYLSK